MKLFIRRTILFIPYCFAIYLVLITIWGSFLPYFFTPNLTYKKGGYGYQYSRIKEIKNHGDTDIVVLGSSHAYRGFDPRIFEKRDIELFNLGSSNQTPLQTKLLVDRYLNELSPEIIIYEVYPLTFTSNGVESSVDIIANDSIGWDTIQMAYEINNLKTYNTLLFGLIEQFILPSKKFTEPRKKNNDTYINGGFVTKDLKFYDPVSYPKKSWRWNKQNLRVFEEIVETIKTEDIKLILVQAPVTKTHYRSYTNNAEYHSTISRYGKYYNFNKIMNLNDSLHFYDKHHLNQKGVTLFNNRLINILSQDKRFSKVTE